MAAPWPLRATIVSTSLLDPLGLPLGGPVSDSFRVHFGGGVGTHFWSNLQAVSGLMLDLILSALSIPESSKKANGISEDPSPKLGKLPLHASQVLSGLTELVLLCFVRLPSLGQ